MNYQSDTTSTLADEEDHEVSLREILYRLWRQRGTLVTLPLLALCLAAVIVGFKSWSTQNPVVYYVALSNIDKGHYPNGAEFSPQDLLAPDVLAELRQRFKLGPNINPRHYIQVGYDNPLTDSVTRKYHDKLSAKTLT
ncbi:MAG: hypothetical protein WBA42_10340 [Mesorhizobium sp.]